MLRHSPLSHPDSPTGWPGQTSRYAHLPEEARQVLDAGLVSGAAEAPIRRTVDKSLAMLSFLMLALLASLLFPSPVFLTMGGLGSLMLWLVTIAFPALSGVCAKTFALLSGLLLGSATNQLGGSWIDQPVILVVVLLTVLLLFSRLLFYRHTHLYKRFHRPASIGIPVASIAGCYLLQRWAQAGGHPVLLLHEAGWRQWLLLMALAIPATRYMVTYTDRLKDNLRPECPEHMEWYTAMEFVSTLFRCYAGGWKMILHRQVSRSGDACEHGPAPRRA